MALSLARVTILLACLVAAADAVAISKTCNLLWKYPSKLTSNIYVGTTCTWTWGDDFSHCIRILTGPQKFQGPLITGQGLTYSHKFTKAGTYTYNCCLHNNYMKGTMVVHPVASKPPPCAPKCYGRCWGTNHCGGTCPLPRVGLNSIAACTKCCALYQPSAKAKCVCYANCRRVSPAKLHC